MELSKSVIKHLREELPGVKKLELTHQEIGSIAVDCFEDDADIESIDLSSNEIKSMDENVFAGLRALQFLDLSGNVFKKIAVDRLPTSLVTLQLSRIDLSECKQITFSSLVNLETLDLSFSKLDRVSNETFAGMSKLKELNIGQCGLYMYQNDYFKDLKSLEKLDISHNSISGEKKFFTGLENLKSLTAASCGICVDRSLDLTLLVNLTSLNLSGNRIEKLSLEVTFYDASKIETLDLSLNPKLTLRADTFRKFTNLTFLELSECKLKSLDSNVFRGLEKLENLQLLANLFEKVGEEEAGESRDKENKPKAGLFNFNMVVKKDQKKKNHISRDALVHLKSLKILEVSESLVDLLGSNLLSCLTNLEELYLTDLSKNSKKVPVILRKDTFKTLTKLRALDLSGNDIEVMDNDCFAPLSNSLETLELNYTFIQSKPDFDLLKDLKKLHTFMATQIELDFSSLNYDHFVKNPNIKQVTMRLDQKSLIRFRAMIAAKNVPLTKHVDEFNYSDLSEYLVKNMKNLTHLDLSDNNLNSLNDGIFDHLSQLVRLDLSRNYLTEIPGKTFDNLRELEELDLSTNKICWLDFNRVFKHLDKLQSLNLTNNHIVECNIDETCNLKALNVFYLHSTQKNSCNLILIRKMFAKKNRSITETAKQDEEDLDRMFDELEKRIQRLEPSLENCKATISQHMDSLAEKTEKLDVDFFQPVLNQERSKMIARSKNLMKETVANLNVLADAFKRLKGDIGHQLREHIMEFIKTRQLKFFPSRRELDNIIQYVVFKWKNRFDNLKLIRYYDLIPDSYTSYDGYLPLDGFAIRAELLTVYHRPEGVRHPNVDDSYQGDNPMWNHMDLTGEIQIKLKPEADLKAEPIVREIYAEFKKIKNGNFYFYTYGQYFVTLFKFENHKRARSFTSIYDKRMRLLEIEDHPTGNVPLNYLRSISLLDVYDKNLKRVAKATVGHVFNSNHVAGLNDYGILIEKYRLDKANEHVRMCSIEDECEPCADDAMTSYALYGYDLKCKKRHIRVPGADDDVSVIKFTDELFYLHLKSKSTGETQVKIFNYVTQSMLKTFDLFPDLDRDKLVPVVDRDNNLISVSTSNRIKCYNLDTGESSSSTMPVECYANCKLLVTKDGSLMNILDMRTLRESSHYLLHG